MSSNMKSMATLAAGISLFSVTGYLLWLLLKKDEHDKSDRIFIRTADNFKLEVKIPKEHVRSVIGRNGSHIKEIEKQSKTRINFKDQQKSDSFRICVVRGNVTNCSLAESLIHEFIANQPVIISKDLMVPRIATGRIIGRCGERVHNITTMSGAKIHVAPESENIESPERRIHIKGTKEQIEAACSYIMDVVKEEAEARQRLEDRLSKREPRGKAKINGNKNGEPSFKKSWEKLTNSATGRDGHMEVYVSAAVNPSQFWLQIVGPNANELDQLVEEMTDYYSKSENKDLHVLSEPAIGEIVAAVFNFDEKWYRAEIVTIKTNNEDQKIAQLYYVDYGDTDEVPVSEIYELRTDFLRLRFQAIECFLARIKPKDSEWNFEAADRFDELTHLAQWKKLRARVNGYRDRDSSPYGKVKREGSPIPGVDLYDVNNEEDIDIGLELVRSGFAVFEESQNGSESKTSENQTSDCKTSESKTSDSQPSDSQPSDGKPSEKNESDLSNGDSDTVLNNLLASTSKIEVPITKITEFKID